MPAKYGPLNAEHASSICKRLYDEWAQSAKSNTNTEKLKLKLSWSETEKPMLAVVPPEESKAVHRVELNSTKEVETAVEDKKSEVSNEVADSSSPTTSAWLVHAESCTLMASTPAPVPQPATSTRNGAEEEEFSSVNQESLPLPRQLSPEKMVEVRRWLLFLRAAAVALPESADASKRARALNSVGTALLLLDATALSEATTVLREAVCLAPSHWPSLSNLVTALKRKAKKAGQKAYLI